MNEELDGKLAQDDKLTAKQEMFCQHYVATNNGAKSAKLAGYKGDNVSVSASRLLSNAKIQRRINHLREKELRKINIDKSDTLTWIVDMANPVNEYKYNPNVRLKALEMLGKAQGLFIDRKEVTQETTVNVHNPANLSDEELDKLLEQYESTDDEATYN